jgi:hypothetical protein
VHIGCLCCCIRLRGRAALRGRLCVLRGLKANPFLLDEFTHLCACFAGQALIGHPAYHQFIEPQQHVLLLRGVRCSLRMLSGWSASLKNQKPDQDNQAKRHSQTQQPCENHRQRICHNSASSPPFHHMRLAAAHAIGAQRVLLLMNVSLCRWGCTVHT